MSQVLKDQKKALKTTLEQAISASVAKITQLKDKKIQKAVKKAASDIAKKVMKVHQEALDALKAKTEKPKPAVKKAKTASKPKAAAKKPAAKKPAAKKPAVKKVAAAQ